ncbi:MAG: methyltransferase domain-containing protein [Candidatus Omnitrophica bacterium]|nr:methyltransferase domain-containing protein [Candidatus Omnitrophota bacterium]
MEKEKRHESVSPGKILDMGWDFARVRTLTTAVELDIFGHIYRGNHTTEKVSSAANTNPRATEMLLNALVGLELLKKNNGQYQLTDDTAEFLVSEKPGFLGGMLKHMMDLHENWGHLTECVKTGKPYESVDVQKKAEDFFPSMVKGLFNMNYQASKYAGTYLKEKNINVSSILDVAAGSGVWGIGVAQQFENAKLTALDFPEVCKVTKDFISRYKLDSRAECIEGNLRELNFGEEKYDLITLGHICHSEGKANTPKLLKKSWTALKPQGHLLIAEFTPNDEKTGPAVPLLFALNMLVNTSEGDIFTFAELKKLLMDTGFKKVEKLEEAPSISPLILAKK